MTNKNDLYLSGGKLNLSQLNSRKKPVLPQQKATVLEEPILTDSEYDVLVSGLEPVDENIEVDDALEVEDTIIDNIKIGAVEDKTENIAEVESTLERINSIQDITEYIIDDLDDSTTLIEDVVDDIFVDAVVPKNMVPEENKISVDENINTATLSNLDTISKMATTNKPTTSSKVVTNNKSPISNVKVIPAKSVPKTTSDIDLAEEITNSLADALAEAFSKNIQSTAKPKADVPKIDKNIEKSEQKDPAEEVKEVAYFNMGHYED